METRFDDLCLFFGLIAALPAFAVFLCLIIDMAMWGRAPSFAARVCAALAGLILTSPFAWCLSWILFADYMRIPHSRWRFIEDLIIPLEIFSWPVRMFFACWLLRSAVRRLDPEARNRKMSNCGKGGRESCKSLAAWGLLWIVFNLALFAEGMICLDVVQALAREAGHDCLGMRGDRMLPAQLLVAVAANAVFICGPLAEFFAWLFFGFRIKKLRYMLFAGMLLLPALWILIILSWASDHMRACM